MPRRFSSLLRLLRPRHWVKNGFVLAPLLFRLPSVEAGDALRALAAAAAFSFVSSAVYALNDIADREADRRSRTRRHRPLAAGDVSPREAAGLAAACLAAATAIALALPRGVGALLGGYLLLNLAYSWRLKRLVLIDVMAIAAGFMCRVFTGAAALGVSVSAWMTLTTFFLSLFLGFAKRRSEIVTAAGRSSRAVLAEYTAPFLDVLIVMAVTLTAVTYSLYVIQAVGRRGIAADLLVGSVPLVVYGLLRYLFLVMRRGKGGDVAEVVLADPPLLAVIAGWAAAVVIVLVAAP